MTEVSKRDLTIEKTHSRTMSFRLFRTLILGVFFVFGFIFFFGHVSSAQAAIRTWTGTSSNLWSNAGNWGGTAPVTGDDLVFPNGASNLSNTNDLTENTIFNSITFSGSGYTVSGNTLILGAGVAGITDSASSGGNTISLNIRLDVTRDISVTNTAETLTISGTIAGVGGINKEGTGMLVLSGANTYGGATKINVGILSAQNNTALGSIAGDTEVVGGAALELQGTINIGYEPLALRGYGVNGGGALVNVSDNNTFAGLITLSSAGGTEIYSNSGTLTITGGMTGAFPLVIDGAGNVTYSTTAINTGAGIVTKNGAGTLTYNFPNTYTGLTTVNAGTLRYGIDNAILSGAVTVTGGTLDIATYSDMVGAVTLGTLDGEAGTITGTTGILSSATFTVYAGTISAIIAGDGGTLTKTTSATVTLTRANQFTGAVTLSAGILDIQNSLALGTIDGTTSITTGATLLIDGTGMTIPEFITIAGTGLINAGAIENTTGNNTITGLITQSAASTIESDAGDTLTISTDGVTGAFTLTTDGSGNITFDTGPIAVGTGGLIKDGSGTLTLNTFNPYTGSTVVDHGMLTLSGGGSIIQSTVMQINTDGAITVDNTSGQLDRLSDSLALTMAGGDFNLYGSSSSNVLSIVGALTLSSAQNKINFYPGSGGYTILRFASFSRTAGASLLVRGANLGSAPGAGNSNLMFNTPPTLVGDDGPAGSPTVSILQGVFGDASTSGDGTDLVTYSDGNDYGLRLLNGAGFSNEYTSDITKTNANVRISSATTAVTTQINSLVLDTGASITDAGSAQTITFMSGDILNLAAGTTIGGTNTTLAGGTVEFILRMVDDATVSANITTSGGITKSGAGDMTLSTAQAYSGATHINRGTLTVGVANAIPSASAVVVDSSTLDLGNFNDTVSAVTLQGGTITSGTGILTGTSYTVRDGTISAILAGSVALTKNSTNTNVGATAILTRNNTYTGATTISSGILQLGAAGDGTNGPLGTTAGATTIASGASLDLNGYTLSTSEPLTMSGTGIGARGAIINTSATAVTWNGAITLAAAARIGANFGDITIGGGLSGAFALTIGGFSNINITGVISTITTVTKDGFGTYTPSNNNSYTGLTTISAGTLTLGAVGDGTNSPLGTIAGATSIALGARLDLNGYTLSTAEPLTLNGVGYELGDFASGALMNSSASSVTYSGLITLAAASTIKADYGNISLTAAGTITGSGFGLTLGGTGTGSLASIIGTGAGTVTKIGTGLWNLSGASTFTGATTVNLGTLQLGATGGATNTPLGTTGTGTSVMTGAVLDLNGYTLGTAEALTLNGRGISDGGALVNNSASGITYSGAIVLATDTRIVNSGAGLLTVTGGVTGAFALYVSGAGNTTFSTGVLAMGVGSLVKQGSGTVTNNGSATYTGATRIDAGTFAYGASGLLAATPVAVTGGIWDMDGVTDTVGTVTLIGGTIQNGTLTGTGYTFENGTISAVLTGALLVAKNSDNTVTLSGADTISSTTTINAGTLVLSGSGSATSSTFTINLGGTLTLDNTSTAVASRLGDALAVTMNGGNFNFIGNSSGAASETAGALTLASGHNVVTITPGAGGSTTMNFTSLARTAGATVLFRGTSLGSTPAANVSTLMFTTTPPTLTGAGGAANSTTISVVKGAFGDSSLSGTGSDMVTYNIGNSNGLRLLNGAGFSGEYATALTTNTNVKLTGNVAASTASINSLILNGFGITNSVSATTITLASAALAGNILINSATNIAGANTTLGITTLELDVLATANSTISAIIGTATTGLVALSGPGNVTLSATNLYTGITYINNATLTYGASNAISSGGVTIVGGTYNLAGNSDTVGSLSINAGTILTGAGTLTTSTGALTTIANNNASTIISGNLALGAAGAFNIADGLMDDDVVISAVISGAFALTKQTGAGVLELSGSNTYTGLTTVSAGTLRLGAAGGGTNTPLGTTAGGTTISGLTSVLDLNGYTLGTTEALTLSGSDAAGELENTSSTAVSYSGLITLGAAAIIAANYGDINITNTGNITGATFGLTIMGAGNGTLASNLNTTTGTLTKNGLGAWTVSGSSTYTGLTTISAGTLRLGAAGGGTNTPLGTTGSGTSITSGAILDLNGYTLGTAEALTINGAGIASVGAVINNSGSATTYSGAITMGAASTIANYGAGVLTFSGAISGNFALTAVAVGGITQSSASVWSGTGSLVKQGSGTLILTGQNSMTGAMTVSTGTLQVGANGGSTNTPLGTIAGGVTVSAGAVLDLSTFVVGGASTWEPLTLNGSGLDNTGALISSASSGNSFGAVTVSTNSRVINSGIGTINLTGTVTIANGINLGVGGSGPTTISGSFGASGTSATLTKWDSGTLILSGASNVTTGLTRINGGTLQYGTSNAINTGAVTVAGGTLDFNGQTDSVGAVTLQNGGTITDSNGTPGVLTGSSYTFYGGAISGVLGGSAIAMAKSTGDALTLSKTFANTGTLTINAGTVQYLANDIVADTAAVTVAGGTLDVQSYTDTLGTVTLTSGFIIGSGTLTGTSYAVMSGTIKANLAGAVNLTKTTTGTVELDGTNTYTGITTISAGTISVSTLGNGGSSGGLGAATNAAANIVSSTGTGTLQYTGATAATDRNITTTAAITLQIDVTNPSTVLTWNGGTTATTAPFNKLGMGTLVLAAATGHTGVTTVLGGTLQYGVANALSTGAVTVSNGVFDINNYSDSVGAVTLQNDSHIIDSGGSTAVLTSTATYQLQSGTVSARLGSAVSAGISKTTSGRVFLTADNTFTSTTIALSAGYLNLQSNNALGASGTSLTLTVTSGAVLELQGNIALPSSKSITASGTGVNNVGAIRNVSDSNTIGANLTLGASGTRVNSDSGTLTLPTVSGNNKNLIVGGAGNTTITGVIGTTGGTLTKDGAGTLTLTGTNTYTSTTTISAGTLNANATAALGSGGSSNTLIFNGGTLQAGGTITSPSARAVTLTATAIIDTNGNNISFAGTVGSAAGLTEMGTGSLTLSGVTTLGGDLTISSGTFVAPASLTISGNFTNNGTFTHNSGTITFTGASTTTIGGSSSTTFNNFTDTAAGSTITFANDAGGATPLYTFAGTATITGTSGNLITITSDNQPTNKWIVHFNNPTSTITYVNVSYSDCDGTSASVTIGSDSTSGGNNGSCWGFPMTGITISGSVYSDEGTTLLTSAPTVRIKVNGSGSFSATASTSGAFTVSSVGVSAPGDVITVYLDGASQKAVTITRIASASENLSGINLYNNDVIVRHEDAGPITNTNLAEYDSSGDSDIPFTVSGGALTVASGSTLYVPAGKTFAPGGNVTTPNLKILGTYNNAANNPNLTVTGNFIINTNGVFTKGTGTLTFNGGTTQTVTDNNSTKQDLGPIKVSVAAGGNTTLNLGSSITLTDATVDANQTLNANGANTLTVTGSAPTTVTNDGGWCSISATWCNSSWTNRRKITINNSASSSTLTNFPVLVSFSSSSFDFTKALGHGQDIRFTDGSSTASLSFEIEKWASASAGVDIWVKVPSLTATNANNIWMYYDNSGASDKQSPATVWDSNYAAVYHLPNGTSLSANDSTSNGNNGTLVDSPTATVGKIGGGANFVSASTQQITAGTAINPTAITLSAWMKASSFSNPYNGVIGRDDGAASFATILVKSNGKLAPYTVNTSGTNIDYDGTGTNTLSTGTWYYLTMTYNSSSGLVGYVNGSPDGTATANGAMQTSAATFRIGNDAFSSRYFDGVIDEVRVSNIARSADWIKAEYLTDSGQMNQFGTQETYSAPVWTNNGTFTASSGTVAFAPTTSGIITVAGSTSPTFNNISITGGGSTLALPAGTPTTIQGSFTVVGTNSGAPVTLDSNSSGTPWQITYEGGTTNIKFLVVRNSSCVGSAPITGFDSVIDGGGNGTCWGFVNSSAAVSNTSTGNISGGGRVQTGGGYSGGGGGTGGGSGGSSSTLPETFTDTNGTALQTHNSNWTILAGSFGINSNNVYPSASSVGSLAQWTAGSFNNNQYSEMTITASGSTGFIGTAVRTQNGSFSGYAVEADGDLSGILLLQSGSPTPISSTGPGFSAGDDMRLEIQGSNLTLKKNGVSVLTATDSTYASGLPGLFGYDNDTSARADNWDAGSIVGGGGGGGGTP